MGQTGVCREAERDFSAQVQSVKSRAYRRTPQRLSHGLEEAERLVSTGLKAAELETRALEELPGGDPRKVALGKLVRERTVASCEWLAVRLKMRSAVNLSQTLRRTEWKGLMKRLPRTLAEYVNEERG